MAKNDLKKTVASFFEKNKKLLSSTMLEDIEILATLYYNHVSNGHKSYLKRRFLFNTLNQYYAKTCALGGTLTKLIREAHKPVAIIDSRYYRAGWKTRNLMLNDPEHIKEKSKATDYYIRFSQNVNHFYTYLNNECRNDIIEILKSHEKRVKK